MNIFNELNAFQTYVRLWHKLTTGETILWYVLLTVNNRFCWKPWFSVPNEELMLQTGLSKQGLHDARKAIIAKGIIQYKKGSHKQAGSYRIVPFQEQLNALQNECSEEISEIVQATELPHDESSVSKTKPHQSTHHLDINKKKKKEEKINNKNIKQKTKDNIQTELPVHIVNTFKACFYDKPNPVQSEQLLKYIHENEFESELICHAFERAAEKGAPYLYAKRILDSCVKKAINTLAQFHNEQERNRPSYSQKIIREERLPEWFINPESTKNVDHSDKEKELEEVRERLKKYKRKRT